ncbi:hypothetical protein GUITHDRAFT_113881 [Guillardia theta CCMP2712]|uniref:Uncharacterized protein n=1 Tax=Guillardia theta (strain CCMP2712) TaxID=905079 RepID=L1IW79_GUITC|nr:hypothetical protein GUITHDRAFT_113876 [Guillardia theta CCMP2712]XP_005827121.1 hypothetical protein GUITHDRAFT_154254 [Guillardia theta CCMP2712]XP_005827124.1 hypothetical protein GUITHDRAFT_113881 [Guillardia theta CCMP2712]EKX40139.1 hypothetical protein GUITHDRAFT_113876 [Guillardia theta CCMP2712]EKX40141.1 hypothetical protein GUITHDRAFT_154254 [Guillardia theta CCMP2712]EKX40144.1 hypothetical protein GUITHDRAFT_113881 [Guillardia theta CCMP2712]|eukprot:XP_005827119.1 hypothetical protein GUITHDRAFT_113876 [Guillardia theta CCMP2712]
MKYSPDHDCFRTRGVLSRDTIVEIYKLRTNDKKIKTAASASVGLKHGVTAKAIRDIWNRRTWWNVTEALWTEEEREDYARRRKPCGKAGRPRGSKDSKKRRAKIGAGQISMAASRVDEQARDRTDRPSDSHQAGRQELCVRQGASSSSEGDEREDEDESEEDAEGEDKKSTSRGDDDEARASIGIAYSSWSEGAGLPRPIHMSREELWGEALRHVMR